MMPRPDSKIRAYLELLRLPNVFTAIADVIMGYWFAQAALNSSESPAETHLGILVLADSLFELFLSRRDGAQRLF